MVSKTSPFKAGIRKRINTSAVRCWRLGFTFPHSPAGGAHASGSSYSSRPTPSPPPLLPTLLLLVLGAYTPCGVVRRGASCCVGLRRAGLGLGWVGWFASEYPYGFPECFGCDARCLERRFECCLRFAVLFPDGLDVGCGRRECAGAPPGCVPPLRSLRECFQCLRVLWGCELECCAHLW